MPMMFWLTRSTADQWLGVLMLLFVVWLRRPAVPTRTALVVAAGPVICGAVYCVLASGHGWISLPVADDPTLLRDFYLVRYLDWIVVVPITLFAVLSIALTDSAERDREWLKLLGPSTGMTVAAALYAFTWDPVIKTLLYLVFFGFSILLALGVGRVFRDQAKADNAHFKKLRRDMRFLAGLWTCYHVTLLLGSDGLRWFLPSVTTANFENLDFALTVAYPFVALSRVGRTKEAEEKARHHAETLESGPGTIMLRPSAGRLGPVSRGTGRGRTRVTAA